MRIVSLFFAAMLVTACAGQPVNRTSQVPLSVEAIATAQYVGLWHEAARLPNRFQRDCARSTAEYTLREDGMIAVRNTCFGADGGTRDIEGRARRVGQGDEGKLKVSFFGPFWGDYWVIDRADDYSWSIVSEPRGRYLWVLTRAETITPEQRAAFDARLRELGFDTAPMIWNAG